MIVRSRHLAVLLLLAFVQSAARAEDCDRDDLQITTSPSLPLTGLSLHQHRIAMSTLPPSTKMVLIGDSIAYLWPREHLVRLFGENVVKLGIGGDRTQNILLRLEANELHSIRPNNVVIIVGTNNLTNRNKPCAIAAGIEKIVIGIHNLWPTARIQVLDVPPRGPNLDSLEPERLALNAHIAHLDERYPFVSIRSTEVLRCEDPKSCEHYRPDMLHPSPTGYELLTKQLRGE